MTEAGTRPADTTVVIVAFHRPEPLAVLLDQLAAEALEVVVVNVEADPCVTQLVSGLPGVAEVTTEANVGYGAAVNLGVAAASGSVVVFSNDDVVMGAGEVLGLVGALRAGGSSVVLPAVVDADGEHEPTIMASPTPARLLLEWCCLPDTPVPLLRRWLPVEKWRRPDRPEPVPAAAAIVVATNRSTLLARPLPEEYFLYWEEAEWFYELRRDGHVVTYHPECRVRHAGGRADVRPEKSFLLARNAVRCVRRTQGPRAAMAAWCVVVVWQLRLVVLDAARWLRRRDAPSRGRAVARWHGLRGALSALRYLR